MERKWSGRKKLRRSYGSDAPTLTFKWSQPRVKQVWVPKIPAWEKEFCLKVGLFEWEEFLQAKKFVHLEHKIINWDDSECKESFNNAKLRFYAEKNRLPCAVPLPDPDMYIDKLDLSEEEASYYNEEICEIEEDEDEESYFKTDDEYSKYPLLGIEDIVATGWNEDKYEGDPLTGMILGGD